MFTNQSKKAVIDKIMSKEIIGLKTKILEWKRAEKDISYILKKLSENTLIRLIDIEFDEKTFDVILKVEL